MLKPHAKTARKSPCGLYFSISFIDNLEINTPYAGIIRIRLKGSALAISAIMGTPDFYAVFTA